MLMNEAVRKVPVKNSKPTPGPGPRRRCWLDRNRKQRATLSDDAPLMAVSLHQVLRRFEGRGRTAKNLT